MVLAQIYDIEVFLYILNQEFYRVLTINKLSYFLEGKMKLRLLLILLLFSVITYSQDFQVTNMNGYSVDLPHLSISGDYANLVFGTNLRYYRFDVNGPASPNDSPIIPAENWGPNTTDIAADPDNENHIAIVYNDYHYNYSTGESFYGCYITESTDGGTNWDTPTMLDIIKYGNSLDNILYNIPQVEFMNGMPFVLWRVHSNDTDTNAVYFGSRYGVASRIDDPSNNDYELALGLTLEKQNGSWITAISYGKQVDMHAKFYLCYKQFEIPSFADTKFVKDDGQSYLTMDHLTKAFVNDDGSIKYIYSDFSHGPYLTVSNDWGNTWSDAGTVESHKYIHIAFGRTSKDYFVKLYLSDSDDLVYYVSPDLLNWQYGGKLNSDNSSIEGYAGSFIDLVCDAEKNLISSVWIDNRTGNSEIFYGKANLPEITDVETNDPLPTKFTLQQNYPNPFNPSTSIVYSVPSNERITLKVYDVLGNEVSTLVNEQKAPGNYEVTFNASNLSSGVYFYRLQSSRGFIATKKLILLK